MCDEILTVVGQTRRRAIRPAVATVTKEKDREMFRYFRKSSRFDIVSNMTQCVNHVVVNISITTVICPVIQQRHNFRNENQWHFRYQLRERSLKNRTNKYKTTGKPKKSLLLRCRHHCIPWLNQLKTTTQLNRNRACVCVCQASFLS